LTPFSEGHPCHTPFVSEPLGIIKRLYLKLKPLNNPPLPFNPQRGFKFPFKGFTSLRKLIPKSRVYYLFRAPQVLESPLSNPIQSSLIGPLLDYPWCLEDVTELRGHRRTYVGPMPGRVVQGLIEAKSMDPVFVLDEIDKISRSYRGDPTAVLLEILDPEQNTHYRDYYLNFSIDLSKVIFIATANDIGRIPPALRDRMEIIFLSSYTPNEKLEIAKRYLIPQEIKRHALRKDEISITKKALKALIDEYTRESGVRNLRRKISMIVRKVAKEILEDPTKKHIKVTYKNLSKYAGKRVFEYQAIQEEPEVGVVNGLAWTSVGGDVLAIEVIKIKGKGQIQLTGSLGDVMKESAKIASSVVKILIDKGVLDVDISSIPLSKTEREKGVVLDSGDIYKRYDLHIHIPEGATPKDGPSAGITMATAIASILTDRKVDNRVAMTGELTLTGKVLPIGGLKEKLIAAYKAGVTKALIPRKNFERDLDDVPTEVKNGLKIIPVDRIEDVLNRSLLDRDNKSSTES